MLRQMPLAPMPEHRDDPFNGMQEAEPNYDEDPYRQNGASPANSYHTTPARQLMPITNASEANPLRRRVESCLLQREKTVSQMLAWLRTAYRVQQNVGAKYLGPIGGGSGIRSSSSAPRLATSASAPVLGGTSAAPSGGSSTESLLRRWNTLSDSTRDDHRIKCAIFLAGLRMQTCELVEALEEWRQSRPPLVVVASTGQQVSMPRPFVWRGRWWPLQLALDPPLLPLPLPSDPLMLRWFDPDDLAPLWAGAQAAAGAAGAGAAAAAGSATPSPIPIPIPNKAMPAASPGGLSRTSAGPSGVGGGDGVGAHNPAAAPLSLFAPSVWHPPHMLARIRAADALVCNELELLQLSPSDLTRQRHAAPSGVGPGALSGGGGNTCSAGGTFGSGGFGGGVASVPTPARFATAATGPSFVASYASTWSTDGASVQLARMLYGGTKPYLAAVRSLCKRIDAEMAEEFARRDAAAAKIQSISRGRKERKEGKVAMQKRSFQQPLSADGKNEGMGLNTSYALRKEAGGRYGGLTVNFDAASGKSVQDGLREALTSNASRVMDLFRDWDADGNGLIEKKEFRKAIRALGVQAPREEVDKLFDGWDKDGGGTIDAKELAKILRRGAGDDIKLSAELEAGAMGEIELKAENKIKLRESAKDGRSARSGLEPTIFNIKTAMAQDLMRVKDIMNILDKDEDGGVTKEEVRRRLNKRRRLLHRRGRAACCCRLLLPPAALLLLSCCSPCTASASVHTALRLTTTFRSVPAQFFTILPVLGFNNGGTDALAELFDTFDADGGGTIEYDELHKLLRKEFERGE